MMRKDFNRKIEQQSLDYANSHDMLIEALEGQIYLKEIFHKVNTNQVTGEALKKVSVGGKGGMASGSDARDNEKQVEATSRVMVLSGPSQEAFDHNASLEKILVGWDDDGKPIHIGAGETYEYSKYVPSHIFGEKKIKGDTKFTKSHGRDYDEFVHTNSLDPADFMSMAEFTGGDNLESSRALYDEMCGYKDAWKYSRDGMEYVDGEWVLNKAVTARRYRFTVASLLNQQPYKKEVKKYVPSDGYMTWEGSSYNHHVVNAQYELYLEMNPNARKDCFQYIMLQLSKIKNDTAEFLSDMDRKVHEVTEVSEDFLREKAASEEMERKRRFDSMVNAPELRDWRIVYNWELTKQGKIMFL